MFWSRGSSRQRKAVLSALSAVGETGMTLLALGLAVNMPEGRLSTILESLVRSGQVRRRGASPSAIPGPRTAHYQLASGRHSALSGPQPRRVRTERPGHGTPSLGRLQPAPVVGHVNVAGHVNPPTRMRSTRAHGI
jgi:hypothetical protein